MDESLRDGWLDDSLREIAGAMEQGARTSNHELPTTNYIIFFLLTERLTLL
jgi:hypothetical protein